MANSADVVSGQTASHTQYNNLRADAINTSSGHKHDGTNGRTLYVEVDETNVSATPTDAELDAAFGAPATVGAGFLCLLDDAGGDAAVYLVGTNGTSWWYVALTKAA
jgi:hypothetical protein